MRQKKAVMISLNVFFYKSHARLLPLRGRCHHFDFPKISGVGKLPLQAPLSALLAADLPVAMA